MFPCTPTLVPRCLHLLLFLVLLYATGCGGGETEGPAPGPGAPVRGGHLRVAMQDTGQQLDPHRVTDAASMRLIENLHATLLRYGPDGRRFEKDLARSVTVEAGGRRWVIELVEEASFHGGRPVRAEDVVFSIERIRREGTRAHHFDGLKRLEAAGPHTVVLVFDQPMAALRAALAHPMNAVLDREAIEAGADPAREDVGAGPFRLERWRRGEPLVMARHAGYHVPGRPRLARVTMIPMPDESARMTALRTGTVDLVLDVPAAAVARVETEPALSVSRVPGTFWEYVGINCRRPPLDDPRVRRAVAWAVDRAQVSTLVKFSAARVLRGGHLPPWHWAATKRPVYPGRDLARARALLEEAGVRTPIELTLKVGASFPYQVRAAEVVKQQIEAAGFEVDIRALESGTFFADLGEGRFDLTLVGWVGFVDPDAWTYPIFHSGGRYNQQGYASESVDAWLEEARRTMDRQVRASLYRKIQRRIARDAPVVHLYVNDEVVAMRRAVGGFAAHPTATTIGLRRTWIGGREE